MVWTYRIGQKDGWGEKDQAEDEKKLEAVLKENGWRKATDVAAEIFAEIETSLFYKPINGEIHFAIRESDYKEYKQKYTGEGKWKSVDI